MFEEWKVGPKQRIGFVQPTSAFSVLGMTFYLLSSRDFQGSQSQQGIVAGVISGKYDLTTSARSLSFALSLCLSFARQTTASSASIHQPHPPKPAVGIDDGGELIIHNSNDHDK